MGVDMAVGGGRGLVRSHIEFPASGYRSSSEFSRLKLRESSDKVAGSPGNSPKSNFQRNRIFFSGSPFLKSAAALHRLLSKINK